MSAIFRKPTVITTQNEPQHRHTRITIQVAGYMFSKVRPQLTIYDNVVGTESVQQRRTIVLTIDNFQIKIRFSSTIDQLFCQHLIVCYNQNIDALAGNLAIVTV